MKDILKQLEEELVKRWDITDGRRKPWIKEQCELWEKLGPFTNDGYKQYHLTDKDVNVYRYETDAETHERNVKSAAIRVGLLRSNIEQKIGTVDNWDELHLFTNGTKIRLSGFVSGKDGRVAIESTSADGQQICRVKLKVLVKKIE